MRDFEQHALEIVQHAHHLRLAGFGGALAIEAVLADEILRPFLLRRQIDRAVRFDVVEFDEHQLGALQVFAHGGEQHAAARVPRSWPLAPPPPRRAADAPPACLAMTAAPRDR